MALHVLRKWATCWFPDAPFSRIFPKVENLNSRWSGIWVLTSDHAMAHDGRPIGLHVKRKWAMGLSRESLLATPLPFTDRLQKQANGKVDITHPNNHLLKLVKSHNICPIKFWLQSSFISFAKKKPGRKFAKVDQIGHEMFHWNYHWKWAFLLMIQNLGYIWLNFQYVNSNWFTFIQFLNFWPTD